MVTSINPSSSWFIPNPPTELSQIHTLLPQYDDATIQKLINVNRGRDEGRMITLGIVQTVQAKDVYTIDGNTLKPSQDCFATDLEWEATNPQNVIIPDHLEFEAEWDSKPINSGHENNVLGDNGGLYFNEPSIRVPVVKATTKTLAYYGALVIPHDQSVRFPNEDPFPLWKMEVGAHYVNDYIMNANGGGGFYLEFHHDQPHFHMIVNGGGYYLLAKQVAPNRYHLTAFELSSGQAIYTKKGAIHCDAALVGEIVCGYTVSNNCETVLLRTKNHNHMVNIELDSNPSTSSK